MIDYIKTMLKEIDYFYEWCPKENGEEGEIISYRNNDWEIPMPEGTVVTQNLDEAVAFIEEADYDLSTFALLCEQKLGTKVLVCKKEIETITNIIGAKKVQLHLEMWEETFVQLEKALNKIVKNKQKKSMQVIEGGE